MDYYLELEVPNTATEDEIKSSFRKLAKQYHPDKNPGNKQAEEKFKKIASAYEILSDKTKKKKYDDSISRKDNQGRNTKSNPETYYEWGNYSEFNINDLFNNVFSKIKLNFTEEIKLNVSVKLEDLVNKNQKIITIDRKCICKSCNGNGGSNSVKCNYCFGVGSIKEKYSTIFGISMKTAYCPICIGRGTTPEICCSHCDNGLKLEKHNIYFNIPEINSDLFNKGIEIKNEGHSNILKSRGSIKINFKEIKHDRFKRDNLDLYTTQRESLKTLILGGTMNVKSLDSTFKIKVNPNSEGTEYRLKGKGLPGGDLYVTLEALIPNAKDLSLEELEFIERLYNKMQN